MKQEWSSRQVSLWWVKNISYTYPYTQTVSFPSNSSKSQHISRWNLFSSTVVSLIVFIGVLILLFSDCQTFCYEPVSSKQTFTSSYNAPTPPNNLSYATYFLITSSPRLALTFLLTMPHLSLPECTTVVYALIILFPFLFSRFLHGSMGLFMTFIPWFLIWILTLELDL